MKRHTWTLFAGVIASGLAIAFMLAILAGCAATDPPVVDGCAMNLKKACQYLLDNYGVVSADGLTQTMQQFRDRAAVRHEQVHVPFRGSGANMICVVDTQSGRVTDAAMAPGPQPDASNIEQMRQKGLCS